MGFTLLIAYFGLCGIVFISQRSLIYHPTAEVAVAPANLISLNVDGAVLKISVQERESKRAVIYFGGNAETVARSLPDYAQAFPDQAVYMLHYRGFSGSTGTPSEEALHRDAEKLYELVLGKHPEITVIGRSLGSGVAVRLAARRPVVKLILITPYDSILNLGRQRFPYLPVALMLQDKFESTKYSPKVNASTLIVAAENDQTIPLANSKALFESFQPGVAQFMLIKNTDHYDIADDQGFFGLLTANGND